MHICQMNTLDLYFNDRVIVEIMIFLWFFFSIFPLALCNQNSEFVGDLERCDAPEGDVKVMADINYSQTDMDKT